MNSLLHKAEINLCKDWESPLSHAPIFIIGAPRSGSTLLYQVMLTCFNFAYISNLHAIFYGLPTVVEKITHPSEQARSENFASEFGDTKGWFAPNEAGAFWYRFFTRHPQYVTEQTADPQKMKQMRAVLKAFTGEAGKPILFKNMNCALRLEPMISTIPEALFIVIRRNLIDNARSLLEARKSIYGDYDSWWSLQPPEFQELLQRPNHEQVVEQINGIHRVVDAAKRRYGEERFFEARYEDLCRAPWELMNELDVFFSGHDLSIERKGQCPASFERSVKMKLEPELFQRVVEYVNNAS